ncbi:MAG: SDR family oxidoreductase [Gammaproteobacteria bacterium]|nr:SDR family oxidoreductase [Gammaproteobacteria bacterium]
MGDRLRGKVALVTGASQGIGAAIARRFAAEGAHVALCARRADVLAGVTEDIRRAGGSASHRALDVADDAALTAFVADTAAAQGRLDVVVNNAPSVTYGAVTDMTIDTFRRDFRVNVDAAFVTTREAFRIMLPARRGSIVNIASINGLLALTGMSAYGAAKAALIHFTRCAAIEGAPAGVRVNVIAPGVINTPATAAGFAGPGADWGRKIAAAVPLGRFGEADEIAATALFLASDESSYVTGACLTADGGKTAELFVPPP